MIFSMFLTGHLLNWQVDDADQTARRAIDNRHMAPLAEKAIAIALARK